MMKKRKYIQISFIFTFWKNFRLKIFINLEQKEILKKIMQNK